MRLALRHGWCLIDDDDWHGLACMWTWRSALSTIRSTGGRPARTAYVIGHRLDDYLGTELEMHRLVLGLAPYREDKRDVDHVNGDGLDNRRANLRVAETAAPGRPRATSSRSLNVANSASRGGTSRYKGVSFDRRNGRWKAQIMIDGRNRNLGRYLTEDLAAGAYNAAASEAWGEFARLNVIDDA